MTDKQAVMIASPEKAICDKIIMTPGVQLRSPAQALTFLIDDLRIDEVRFQDLDIPVLACRIAADTPKRQSLKILLKGIRTNSLGSNNSQFAIRDLRIIATFVYEIT